MARKKGLEGCFLQYGVWQEDMGIVEATCLNGYKIDPEWFKETILKAYQDKKVAQMDSVEQQNEAVRIIKQALKALTKNR